MDDQVCTKLFPQTSKSRFFGGVGGYFCTEQTTISTVMFSSFTINMQASHLVSAAGPERRAWRQQLFPVECFFGVNLNEMLRMLLSWHQPRGRDTHYLSHLTEITLLSAAAAAALRSITVTKTRENMCVCVYVYVCNCLLLVGQKPLCYVSGGRSLHGSHSSSSSATGHKPSMVYVKTLRVPPPPLIPRKCERSCLSL